MATPGSSASTGSASSSSIFRLLFIGACLIASVLANTEKAIFLGPEAINIPATHPNLDDLTIDTLTPQDNWAIRTRVEASFPNASNPFGRTTWLILDELAAGQRYEVRVCWAATQPTDFRLTTYELEAVFGSPELVTDLSDYSSTRLRLNQENGVATKPGSGTSAPKSGDWSSERKASVLLLHLHAAASYYTTNQTLMENVPPVLVDIILDPFLFNVLPRSLLPTVGYIIVVAIISWFLARRISVWLQSLATQPSNAKKTQ
ncbi:hypothetical protein BX600DRAFT_431456 [Xylariales sp. PMI_506]|nr:hypothetical protein BX600DRAFT_431456 [Xylariales sp. PMI_506]